MEVNIEEICQDSPQFNLKIKKHEQEVEVLLENLIRILQVSQKFTKSATKFSNIGNEFANEITNFQANKITTTLDNQVSSLLQTCSLKLQEINQTRVLIFTQIENLLVQPVEEFITNDIGPVKRARLKLDQLTIEKKSLTKKVQEQKNNRELITQLGEIEKQYLLTKFELVSNLHKIQAKKKFDMVERIAAIIYSQLTFFHSGYDSLTEIENQMRDLVLELEGVKVNYEKKIQEDNQKKQNLLTILEEKKKKSAIQQKKQTQRLRPQPQPQQKKQKVMEKKGSLFKKSESGNKEWEKKFFSIKNNRIYYINTQNNSRKIESLDLRLCTVKQINDNNTNRNCFEVLGKEKKYLLQSETSQERLDWIEVIKNNILPSHNQEGTTKPNTTQSTRPQPKKTIPNQNNEKNLQILKLFQTIRGNNICADCSRENPQWCSITHGVLICDDCSSIHRTLGEDISKVKSILSSEWKEESIELIKELGNLRVNSIYERKLIRRKPTINSVLDYKKTFITEKYKEKKYLQKLGSSAELNEKLYNSIQNNKLFDSFFCIAYGANPNWKNAKRQNQTSLHHAIASCNKSIINLLLISGSRFDIIDSNMQTPLHIAVKNRKIELVKRFIDLGHWLFPPAVDQNFKTAYNLAQELNFTEACLLLKDSYQKEKSIKKIEMKQQDQRLFQQQELELNEKRKQFLSLLPMNTRPKNDAPELPPKKYQDFDSLWPYYLTNPLVKEFVSSVGEQIKTTKQNKTVVKK